MTPTAGSAHHTFLTEHGLQRATVTFLGRLGMVRFVDGRAAYTPA